MVIELTGVQFGQIFISNKHAQAGGVWGKVIFQTKIAQHKAQLPL